MRWIISLVVLIAARVSLSETEEEEKGESCMDIQKRECDPSVYPEEFPDTTEELKDICQNVLTLGRCLLGVEGSCIYYSKIEGPVTDLMNYVEDTCQEGNPHFDDISRDIECIGNVGNNHYDECKLSSFSNETKARLISLIKEFADTSTYLSENDHCIHWYWYVVCPSELVGHYCGSESKNAVYEVLQNIDINLTMCGEKRQQEVKKLREIFASVINEKLRGEDEDIEDFLASAMHVELDG